MARWGGAGHSTRFLKKTDAFLVEIDCDEQALQFADQGWRNSVHAKFNKR